MADSAAPPFGHNFALRAGTELGHYRVERVLGSGSFGITYLARHTALDRRVAIKEFMPRDLASRGPDRHTVVPHANEEREYMRVGLEQFRQESRLLASLDHANVVRVRSYFSENDTAYLVMDYSPGQTLASYLKSDGRLPLDCSISVDVTIRILDGLKAAHARRILHRDVKPQNVYLTTRGHPILIDFGAARMAVGERSQNLTAVVTPPYAPWEQYATGNQGPWTDIYAVAVMMYYMTTGRLPPGALERKGGASLRPPRSYNGTIPGPLSDAIMRGMSVDPSERPQSAGEFQQDLLERDQLFVVAAREETEGPSESLDQPDPSAEIDRATDDRRVIETSPSAVSRFMGAHPLLSALVLLALMIAVGLLLMAVA